MSDHNRPMFYYLFPEGDDFKILHMTDEEAAKRLDRGERFVDVAQRTLADAQELRAAYLKERKSTSQG